MLYLYSLKTPENITVYEHVIATYWLDEDGICHSVSKDSPRTLENIKDNVEFLKKIFNNKKICILVDTTQARPYEKGARDYMASELKNIFKAMAIVSDSLFGRTIANNLIAPQILDPGAIPTKTFSSDAEAKEWLKKYL